MIRAALLFALACVSGCSLQPQTAARIDRHGSPVIAQTGAAKTPAAASVTTSKTILTIPAGSKVEIPSPSPTHTEGGPIVPPAPGIVVTLSAPSELHQETRREAVAGAETPAPPAPPSPTEVARAFGVKWFYLAGIAAAFAAGVCVWRGYPIAAVKFAAAAVAFPLVGNIVSSTWAIVAGGVLVLLGLAFVIAWKVIAARHALTAQS